MSLRKDLAKEIGLLENEIKELEVKRTRSMSALMESLISKREPEETEMQFFRQYSAEIEVKRGKLTEITKQLKSIV
ncbi:MAG: hypothetical protein HFE47_07305 [Clostridia bacterium]|nr:hypothetical protein [Clostridia bacterium]